MLRIDRKNTVFKGRIGDHWKLAQDSCPSRILPDGIEAKGSCILFTGEEQKKSHPQDDF